MVNQLSVYVGVNKFGHELITLFDEEDNQSWFESKFGVPFYIIKCETKGCSATWNFGISKMYEEDC